MLRAGRQTSCSRGRGKIGAQCNVPEKRCFDLKPSSVASAVASLCACSLIRGFRTNEETELVKDPIQLKALHTFRDTISIPALRRTLQIAEVMEED